MNKDKQIDEMAKDLCHTETCEIKKIGIPCNHRCKAHIYATRAVDKGYAKASEVAREIFAEIEQVLNMQAIIICQTRQTVMKEDEAPLSYMAMLDGRMYSLRVVEEHIAELKKKYTEDNDVN